MNMLEETQQGEALQERVINWRDADAVIDRNSRVVRNVTLTGLKSRNGYCYQEAALREAVGLYDGRPVFLDHANNPRRPQERSARDLVGTIQSPRYEQGRIKADVQVLDTESGRTFLALAESNPQTVGMSHVVLAIRSEDKQSVEKIEDVISVDAVVFPATTAMLREQWEEQVETDVVQVSRVSGSWEWIQERLDEAFGELPVAEQRYATDRDKVVSQDEAGTFFLRVWQIDGAELRLEAETKTLTAEEVQAGAWMRSEASDSGSGELQEQDAGTRTVTEMLNEYREKFQEQQRMRQVDGLLEQLRLPQEAVTEEFRLLLLGLKEPGRQREWIEERKRFYRQGEQLRPQSRSRHEREEKWSDAELVKVIKRA